MEGNSIYKKILSIFSSELILLFSRMILVLYVASNMGVYNVGIYTTLMTWASLISLFSLFGGYNIIQKEGSSAEVVSIVLFLSLLLSILISLLVASLLFYSVLYIAVVIVFSESIGLAVKSVAKSVCYSIEETSSLTKVNFINSLTYILGGVVLFISHTLTFEKLAIFIVFYNCSTVVLYGFLTINKIGLTKFKFGDIVRYIRRSYVYLISSSLRNLFIQIDKVIVNAVFGNAASGIYNLCSRFVTIAVLPANIYIQTIESKFYSEEGNRWKLLHATRKNVVLISTFLSILSVPFVYVLTKYLSELNGVSSVYVYFVPFAVSINLSYIYLSYLNADNNTLRILSLSVFIISIFLSVLLVSEYFPDRIEFVPLVNSVFVFVLLVFLNARIKKKSGF